MSYYSMVERVAGHHNMAATRVHNYAETIAKLAEADLRRDGRLSSQTEILLGVLDVTRIVCAGSFAAGCPTRFATTEPEGPLGAVVRVPAATPAVFSRSLIALAPPLGLDKPMLWSEDYDADPPDPQVAATVEFLQRYLRATQLDPASHLASALAVRALPGGTPPSASGTWHPLVTRYEVGLQRVTMTVTSDAPGYVQLSHPWFPGNVVRLNGQPVVPLEGALGLTVVPITAGENAIEISPMLTPIRLASNAVSVVSLLLAFGMAAALGRHRARLALPSVSRASRA
jgi:hypothetical protein